MRAGDLRRKIVVQTRGFTKDSYGQQSLNWCDYLTNVAADIQALSGNELVAAQAINSEVTHLIVTRYMAALADPVRAAAMRLIYINAGVTRYFDVRAVINVDERNRELNFMAIEGLTKG